MCQIGLVANDDWLVQSIVTALRDRTGYQVTNLQNNEFQPTTRFYSFNLLLLTWQTNEQFPSLIESFGFRQPEIPVILMIPAEHAHRSEVLFGLGVDNIIILPENKQQLAATIRWLSKEIASLDNLQALQEKLYSEMRQNQIVAKSNAMKVIMRKLPQLAASDSTVLITGETGTGKELIARAIHYLGPRSRHPFIVVDCGALPEHLVENELFGHMRGAYTDAGSSTKGMIEEADGGSLFLDEVQALPIAVQAKFLRFLQERRYKRLGQTRYVAADVRVIAATNVDLTDAISQKQFRADLYYRLNVLPLYIPPLRERRADIPSLVRHFLNKYTPESQSTMVMPLETIHSWQSYEWPGNVRELENNVQHWLMQATEEDKEALARYSGFPKNIRTLMEVRRHALELCERGYLQELIDWTRGNLSVAARYAGIHRKSLAGLLKKYQIKVNRIPNSRTTART